jgi:phosphoglycerol transferase MdoB-like AlkP superfamily enzyme
MGSFDYNAKYKEFAKENLTEESYDLVMRAFSIMNKRTIAWSLITILLVETVGETRSIPSATGAIITLALILMTVISILLVIYSRYFSLYAKVWQGIIKWYSKDDTTVLTKYGLKSTNIIYN